ncbi:MAG: efflux transporter outer membrane subunit [Alphaproteobacteria bacterium]|nr:efflux transporter outer membrane subunit [Alphaproteobacteria bacterium]
MNKCWVLVLGGIIGLSACAVGPEYQTPDTEVPDAFKPPLVKVAHKSDQESAMDRAEWWRALHDPELDSLIDRAISSNLDLEIALTRLQTARTQELVVIGQALPAGGATGGGGIGTGTNASVGRAMEPLRSAQNLTNLSKLTETGGFEATWEIDVFGKYWRALQEATYNAEALADARDWVLITVAADVARAYLDMRALQGELAVLRKNISVARTSLEFAKTRFERGITNELDVALAERFLGTLQASVAPFEAQIEASRNVIATLLGQFPEELAKELAAPGKLPAFPAEIAPGLPIELLRRRPDIHEAERQLAAATAHIGVATADLFPQVILTGAVGGQGGPAKGTAIPITFIGSAGPSVYWPMLDFGTLDAIVNIAEYDAHALLVNYKQTIITAVQQVDDSVAFYRAAQQRLRDLNRALVAARRATKIANDRYDRGLTDYLNVLDAERQEYDLEQQYVSTQGTAAEEFVALYKALGGGWESHQMIPPIKQPQPALIAEIKRSLAPDEVR